MAIVKLGVLAAGISGKIGGVVFANTKQALVVRPTPVTRHKTSDFLLKSQNQLSRVRRAWATLTTEQQLAWNTEAANLSSTNRLGQTRPRTGFQYFVLTNMTVFPGLPAILDDPPGLGALIPPINPSVVFSVSTGLLVTIDNPIAPALLQIQVYGWPFWVNHDTNAVPRLVFLDERAGTSDPVGDNVITEWEDHFGPVQLGQRYAVGLKARRNSNPFLPMFVFRGTVVA